MTNKRILIELTDVDTFQRLPKKYIDNGDGTFSQVVSNGTIKNIAADPSSNSELLSKFDNFDQVHPSAFVTYKRTSNGQSILAVSADPLTPSVESSVVINQKAKIACELEVEYSINRTRHQFGSICLFANRPAGAVATTTVQYTLVSPSCTFVRARVYTTGATMVAGYVSLKAWS